jgi:hypothetical protein
MPPRAIVPAILVAVVVVAFVHTRVQRGRRLLVLRSRRSALRWAVNVVLLAVAVIGLVASVQRAKGPWDSLSGLSLVLLALSDMGFDLYGRPQPGQCTFHENGILMVDGRRPVFSRWDQIERYEWQGDTLVFHFATVGLAHVGDVRAIDVPPERRGEVLAVVAPRLRG